MSTQSDEQQSNVYKLSSRDQRRINNIYSESKSESDTDNNLH